MVEIKQKQQITNNKNEFMYTKDIYGICYVKIIETNIHCLLY